MFVTLSRKLAGAGCWLGVWIAAWSAPVVPVPQRFVQEVPRHRELTNGLPSDPAQWVEISREGRARILAGGSWHEWREGRWNAVEGLAAAGAETFVLAGDSGAPVTVKLPWRTVRQVVRQAGVTLVSAGNDVYRLVEGGVESLRWNTGAVIRQVAVGPEGGVYVASDAGLHRRVGDGWEAVRITDGLGRQWGVERVAGVAVDVRGRLWMACAAGVGVKDGDGWKFYEGKDGLPWNEFTGVATGADGSVWFGTKLGAIRWDGTDFHYRQGLGWLPHDEVRTVAVDSRGGAWLVTAGGIGWIERREMRLAEKAAYYEEDLERHIQRTPYGYVAEASLRRAGDKTSAHSDDSDNDGLWTAMYGAGECFAVAATGDAKARARARKAFEALRFLQKVTQGGTPAPDRGYIARTIRSVDLPDPNVGRLESDREAQKGDKLWKAYEPRWPKSADGKWYWKSDTSSDELDGHYFFYPLYYEFCADTEAEIERVREVVRDVTDHLMTHGFTLTDHDGKPTRWAVYGPASLNRDPHWWLERGLNSLSLLSYLTVAAYVTGDAKYEAAARELVERHGYAHNAMYAKVQHGPGSGNQSDDEMAFMCYYTLLRYSRDAELKAMMRYSFYRYWANEAPEMNPFFNFAYAAHALGQEVENVWGRYSLSPWDGWLEESMATLHGLALDRIAWGHRNRHRLDLVFLGPQRSVDLYEPRRRVRAQRTNGRVLPVENRYFNHWNTDPWTLDYGGNGHELGSGTVFLLPYYMGLYHGYIEKP